MRALRRTLLTLAALLVLARLALPSVIRTRVNAKLGELPGGYSGRVEDVDLALLRGALALEGIELRDQRRLLVINVRALRVNMDWARLLDLELAASAEVEQPVLKAQVTRALRDAELHRARDERRRKAAMARGEAEPEAQPPAKPLHETLAEMTPFRVTRLELRDGTVLVMEGGAEARVTDLHVVLENLTNQEGGRSARLQAAAKLNETGELSASITADPLAESPTFDADLMVKGVQLPAVNPILRWQMGVDVERGTFELVSEMRAAGGSYEGYVKPLVEDLKMLEPEDLKKPLAAAKEAVVGAVAKVLQNPRTGKVATRVPVKGEFGDPDIGLWPAVAATLRNAFIEALRPSFEGI